MIPPRAGLDDERTYAAGYDTPQLLLSPPARTRRDRASLVFPDGPAETKHTMGPLPLRARPEKSDVGTPPVRPRARCYPCAAFYGPPYGLLIGNARFAFLPFSLSTCQVYRCPLFPRFPLISTVSLITGAIRAARVISARTLARLFLARDQRIVRGTLQDYFGIARRD